MTDQIVQDIFQSVAAMIKDKTVDGSTIVSLTVESMQLVEQIPSLTGAEKKEIVLQVITLIINASPIDPNLKTALDTLVQTTLPTVIDMIVMLPAMVLI